MVGKLWVVKTDSDWNKMVILIRITDARLLVLSHIIILILITKNSKSLKVMQDDVYS